MRKGQNYAVVVHANNLLLRSASGELKLGGAYICRHVYATSEEDAVQQVVRSVKEDSAFVGEILNEIDAPPEFSIDEIIPLGKTDHSHGTSFVFYIETEDA